jgi:hypothetical protein
MTYIISYDLNKPGQNYDELYEEIKAVADKWCWPMDSTWFIVSELSSSEIRNRLNAIDATDSLIVARTSAPASWIGLSNEITKWLQENL